MSGGGKQSDGFNCGSESESEERVHTAARRLISRPVEPAPSPQRTNTRRRLCSRLVASTLPSRLYIPGVNIARPAAENRLPRASLRFVADSTSRAEIELPVFDSSTLASAAVARASGETDPSLSWLFALEESHSEAVHSHFEIRAALVAAHNLSFPSPSHLCQELAQAELLQGVEARHRDTLHLLAEQQVRNREQEQVISDLILQVDTANRIAAALTLPRGHCDIDEGGDLDLSEIEKLKHQVDLLVAENLRLTDFNVDLLDANDQLREAFDTAGERLAQARAFQDRVQPLILRDLLDRRRQALASRRFPSRS